MANMPPGRLGAILFALFASAWLIRTPLQRSVVEAAADDVRVRRQFCLDFLLSSAVGVAAMALNRVAFHFPLIQSGMKLVLGCCIAGFFIGLDTALDRERRIIRAAVKEYGRWEPPAEFHSLTRKFSWVAVITLLMVAAVLGLIISGDVSWLANLRQMGLSLGDARETVTLEVFFVLGVLMLWVINLILSYSKNLALLFDSETSVLNRVSDGDLSALVPVTTNDEFGVIAGHTNRMIGGLRHRLELLGALRLAEEVQRSLLPKSSPLLSGFELDGASVYCEKTGGDYYDFIDLGRDRCVVVVGDVSGHGVSSALLMTTVRALLHQRTAMPGSLDEVIVDVNRQFCLDVGDSGRFITLFCSELLVAERKIRWVRAGHDPALLYDPGTDGFEELGGRGIVLGVMEDSRFELRERELAPGQVIAMGTDGIWECRNGADEMFGKQRFREVIRRNAHGSAARIVRAVIEAVNDFRGPMPPEDDVTMVVLRVVEATPESVSAVGKGQ